MRTLRGKIQEAEGCKQAPLSKMQQISLWAMLKQPAPNSQKRWDFVPGLRLLRHYALKSTPLANTVINHRSLTNATWALHDPDVVPRPAKGYRGKTVESNRKEIRKVHGNARWKGWRMPSCERQTRGKEPGSGTRSDRTWLIIIALDYIGGRENSRLLAIKSSCRQEKGLVRNPQDWNG